ncbi:methanogenesis marker protein Mmp4/MtxX [Methanofollis fontis]|uniref:Phosphotransacetylase n=1 Tax=Methanofollis fontis TaxID=2052832 RepID=A0A483CPI6_9EURY|nr:methanogenesis marker protein Mmp4/MtxX [Methanofollis fontis]TAJ44605.1 phosphotransacetylase [Methanofollis fontis]
MIVGIGAGVEPAKVRRTVERMAERKGDDLRIVPYCFPGAMEGECRESDLPWEALVADLAAGRIDAAVRGSLPANETLKCLKQACGVDRLERIALLETADGVRFLLAPVGVDEGWSISDRLSLAGKAQAIAAGLGLPEDVAVLSGGRLGDLGRHPVVDRSMADAELVARIGGYEHGEILIEDAVGRCGVIIAPDGISGNLIFRTLALLGKGTGHGAPVVNIDRIFVDTSRASPDYTGAVELAASMIRPKNPEIKG